MTTCRWMWWSHWNDVKNTRLDLFSQIVGCPAHDLAMLISRCGLVIAERHDAFGAWNFECVLTTIEQPTKGGGLGLGIHLAFEINSLRLVFVLDGRRDADGFVVDSDHKRFAKSITFYIGSWTNVLTRQGLRRKKNKCNKTDVNNDPLGQTHSPANSDHYSHLKFVLLYEKWVPAYGQKYKRTTCVKMVINSRPSGSI